jgi:hypothetical protein
MTPKSGRFFEIYLNKKTEKNKITNPNNSFNSYKVADTIDPYLVIFLQILIIYENKINFENDIPFISVIYRVQSITVMKQ